MAGDNLSKYFPIVMNFLGYLPLYEDTSATDFGPDRSIRLAGHAPKVGHNELHCCNVCEWDRNSLGCYRYVSFNNLVIAVPKMGHMPESGTFPKYNMVLVLRFFFAILVYVQKRWCCKITSCSRNWTDVLKWEVPRFRRRPFKWIKILRLRFRLVWHAALSI